MHVFFFYLLYENQEDVINKEIQERTSIILHLIILIINFTHRERFYNQF